MANVFKDIKIAQDYDIYYETDFGKQVDKIEKDIIASFLKKIPTGSMLELGCGTGHWTEFFVDLGFDVIGIDSSEAMLEIAVEKNINATLQVSSAEKVPFNDNYFDVVSAITMLEFVKDQDKVLKEIKRVLKPKGWFMLGCLNANSVLGKNKEQDETFKNAKFLTRNELTDKLMLFGKPEIRAGVYLSNKLQIIDNSPQTIDTEPVFMAALVKNE